MQNFIKTVVLKQFEMGKTVEILGIFLVFLFGMKIANVLNNNILLNIGGIYLCLNQKNLLIF